MSTTINKTQTKSNKTSVQQYQVACNKALTELPEFKQKEIKQYWNSPKDTRTTNAFLDRVLSQLADRTEEILENGTN
jgi:hypothetical protein